MHKTMKFGRNTVLERRQAYAWLELEKLKKTT
jgi:hypothetical protein